jgi:hypothetical protein
MHLRRLSNLVHLDLNGCDQITEEAVDDLLALLTKLVVFREEEDQED